MRSENARLRQQLEDVNNQLSAVKESASEASTWKHKYQELESKYDQNMNETVAKKEQENKSQLNEKIRFYKERYGFEYPINHNLSVFQLTICYQRT
jgi:Skp family chaperone for outer membrane proteins